MKLYRFTAADNHRAILKVQETLGPDALVYLTKRTADGVIEVLAGFEDPESEAERQVNIEEGITDRSLIEKLNSQVKSMDEHIQSLSNYINSLNEVVHENIKNIKSPQLRRWKKWNIKWNIKWNFLKNIRTKRNLKEGVYGRQAAH